MQHSRQWHGLDRNLSAHLYVSRIVLSKSGPTAWQWTLFSKKGHGSESAPYTFAPSSSHCAKKDKAQALRRRIRRQSVVSNKSNQQNITHGLFV